jgi:hypothetical protein
MRCGSGSCSDAGSVTQPAPGRQYPAIKPIAYGVRPAGIGARFVLESCQRGAAATPSSQQFSRSGERRRQGVPAASATCRAVPDAGHPLWLLYETDAPRLAHLGLDAVLRFELLEELVR